MSKWDKVVEANAYEREIDAQIQALKLPLANQLKRLLEAQVKGFANHYVVQDRGQSKLTRDEHGNAILDWGHSMDPAAPPDAIRFRSGATLGFIISLREMADSSRLLSASFNLLLPSKVGLEFLRIHIEGKTPGDSVVKSRSHMHPGFQHVHVPFPVMDPRAILDRIAWEFVPKFRHE